MIGYDMWGPSEPTGTPGCETSGSPENYANSPANFPRTSANFPANFRKLPRMSANSVPTYLTHRRVWLQCCAVFTPLSLGFTIALGVSAGAREADVG